MEIVSKKEVLQDLIVVPGELSCDFYVKEIDGDETIYYPITHPKVANFISKQN